MKKKILSLILVSVLLAGCSLSEDTSRGSRVGDKSQYEESFPARNESPGTPPPPPSDRVVVRESEKLKQEREELKKKLAQGGDEVIEVTDKIFVNLINEIYLNRQDYVGKTIRLAGNACEMKDPETGENLHAVLRIGPGCCGNDGVVGFEYVTEGEYPPRDSWIQVTGKLEIVPIGPANIVRLQASDIQVLPERGQERVTH